MTLVFDDFGGKEEEEEEEEEKRPGSSLRKKVILTIITIIIIIHHHHHHHHHHSNTKAPVGGDAPFLTAGFETLARVTATLYVPRCQKTHTRAGFSHAA